MSANEYRVSPEERRVADELTRRGIWFASQVTIHFSRFVEGASVTKRSVDFVLKAGDGKKLALEVDGLISTSSAEAMSYALKRDGWHVERVRGERIRSGGLHVADWISPIVEKYRPVSRLDVEQEIKAEIEDIRRALDRRMLRRLLAETSQDEVVKP